MVHISHEKKSSFGVLLKFEFDDVKSLCIALATFVLKCQVLNFK